MISIERIRQQISDAGLWVYDVDYHQMCVHDAQDCTVEELIRHCKSKQLTSIYISIMSASQLIDYLADICPCDCKARVHCNRFSSTDEIRIKQYDYLLNLLTHTGLDDTARNELEEIREEYILNGFSNRPSSVVVSVGLTGRVPKLRFNESWVEVLFSDEYLIL